MNIRFILRTLLAAVTVLSLAGMAQAQVALRFQPDDGAVGMAETTRLGVYLDQALDVRTIELTVNYDDTYLTSVDGGPGALFESIAGSPSIWQDFDDSTPGQWTGYALVFGTDFYATGPGELFYWNVEGLTPGVAAITSASVALYDVTGTAIADVTLDGTNLEVLPPFADPVFVAEPEFTAGLANTVSWSDTGATEYQVQAATDAGFTDIVGDSGWIGAISREFAGLTDGQIYHYRVRGRSDSPVYESDWSAGTVHSTQDDTAPVSAASALGTYQTSLTFGVPWTGSDGVSGLERVELWVDGGSGYELYDTITDTGAGGPFSFTAPAEGSYSFYTLAYDNVENAEAAPATADASTMVDVTAPSGDLLINGGATLTNDPAVTLTSSISGADQMQFSNDGSSWSGWTAFAATAAWDLTAGDGEKTVFAQYRDLAGNVHEAGAAITLDTTPPAESFVINGDDTYTSSGAVTLAMAGSDAVLMRFSNDGAVWGDWTAYAATAAWDLSAGDGEKQVFGEFQDAAGNVSGADDTIILDTLAPEASFVINGDAEYATDPAVTLTSTSADASEMRFSNDGAVWGDWTAFAADQAWTLAGPDGSNTVYGEFRDLAGNVTGAQDVILLDTEAPAGGLVINADADYTTDPVVELTSTVTGAAEMRFSNDGAVWGDWAAYAATAAWTLAGPDGENTVYGEYRDLAGNLLAVSDAIVLDTTPPEGGFVIDGDEIYATSTAVTLSSSVTGAAQMQFSNDGASWSGWTDYAAEYPWTLAAVQGEQTVYGQYRDLAGNLIEAQDVIILDTEAPTATVVINGDAVYTTTAEVTLDITATGASEMQFSNDGTSWSGWTAVAASYPWTLAGPDGQNTVYAQFQDEAGNLFETEDAILLDTTAPEAVFVINGDAAYATDPAVTLDITATGAVQMQFSNDGAAWSGWVDVAATYPWTLAGPDGAKTVYAQFRDEAGNLVEANDAITLDTTAPEAAFVINGDADYATDANVTLEITATGAVQMQFSNDGAAWSGWVDYAATYPWTLAGPDGAKTVHGQFRDEAGNLVEADDAITLDTTAPEAVLAINGGDTYTTDPTVTLDITATGAVQMQFSDDGSTWSGWVAVAATYPWTLTGPDGEKTVYGQFRDEAGNTVETQDTILLDATAPLASFVINFDAAVTNDPAVTLNITPDDAQQMRFGNDGATWSDWTAAADTYPWNLPSGDGEKTVYGQFRDGAGNVTAAQDQILLDATAPSASLAINGGDAYTTTAEVTLNLISTDATEMQFSNDGAAWSGWTTFAPTYGWTLTGGDGEKTVYAQFRDGANNVVDTDDTIILDTLAPEASFVINGDAPFATSVDVTLDVTADGAVQMQFSNDGADWSAWTDVAAAYPWTLSGPDGENTVHGRFRDLAGNIATASDLITLDTTAPEVPLLAAEPGFTAGDANTVSWSDTSADGYYAEASTDSGFGAIAASSGWIAGLEYTFTGLTDGQTYHYRVKARDELGNETDWSGVESSTQDAGTPVSAAGPLDAYQTGLTFDVPWSGSDAVSGLASVDLFVNDGSGWALYGSTTEVASPAPFTFTAPGEGSFSFYTVATDGVGLTEAAPAEADAATTVDTTAPEGQMAINGGAETTASLDVTLDLSVTGADQMRFSNDGSSWSDWTAYAAETPWTLAGPDGLVTVHGQFRDAAGNELAAEDTILLDTTAPEGLLVINGDAGVTGTTAVVLNSSVTGADQMRFSNDEAVWSEWAAYAAETPWTLSDGDGVKTVHGQYRDSVGNLLAVSDDIILDTTAPDVPLLAAEPEFTAGLANTVSWNATGAAGYYAEAATDGDFGSIQASTGWITNTFFEFAGLGDGQTYYYRVKARDELDNESAWSGIVFSTQDATAPTASAGPLGAYQADLTFDVPWTGSDETSGLASVDLFVDDGSGWVLYGSTTEVDPPAAFSFTAGGEGTYGFYTVARDGAGNVEGAAGAAEAVTVVDQTAPEGALAINGGQETTNQAAVVLNSAVTDLNGLDTMRFSNDGATWSEWTAFAAEFAWTLSDGDGEKTVFAEYRDPAGNVLAVSDEITLDTTPPDVPVFVAEPEFTMGTSNTVAWLDNGEAAYFVQVATDAGFTSIQASSGWVMAHEFTFTGLNDGQMYHYRLQARDDLANETDWGAPVFSTQDAVAPLSAADPLPTYQGTAEITVPWTGSDATSGLASVELFVNHTSEWVSAGVTTQVDPPEPFEYTATEAGTYRFYTLATDVAGNVEVNLGTVDAYTTVDFTAPAAAADLDADPGIQSVTLSWTNPEATDLAAVEVWAALWTVVPGTSAYPEYDDIAAEVVRPASRAAADADEQWQLVATLGTDAESFVHTEGMDAPGVYYYEVFVSDQAGNFSAPAAAGARATNYTLGDFNQDDAINVFDITILGSAYGTAHGDPLYNPLVDVGPTDDGTSTGVPLTDSVIEFEDLTVTALNYNQDKAAVPVEGSKDPALTWYQADETTWVLGLLEPCSSLKALNLAAELPPGVSVTVEAGADLAGDFEFFLANIDRRGLDTGLAVLGADAVLPVTGELLRVTTSTEADLTGAFVRARDTQNESLAVNLSAEPIQALPDAYRLAGNYPNPFNPQTTIAFDLPEAQRVRLVIYDLKGRLVEELISEPMEAGSHSVVWSGTDRSGRRVASGVYFYRIQAGPLQDTRRMMLVK
jgi:hypothetical protein